MKFNRLVYLLFALVIGLMVWIVKDSFTQPSVRDLDLVYKELVFFRNENNTGPIQRVYVVYVEDDSRELLEAYGDYMPHTKYGNTQVYFFTDSTNAPKDVLHSKPFIPIAYQAYCVAKYEKSAMGDVRFLNRPFAEKNEIDQ
ncbi:hypothetical protein ACFOUP_04630 [Belliella kenyensis]|uniref:Uncharacterized protein n=1 Tax=Belliella kenyensis TaxID=1472724 RepID=A0ABV8EJT5_9BACT|nr:hypothetical protein [Belliella kenyensis]MCH7403451.1 hypothetical protein [Belliella kenyensis]MDN3602351.1 hypothetical protein [Belliella kenyensis]